VLADKEARTVNTKGLLGARVVRQDVSQDERVTVKLDLSFLSEGKN
jgi:hypothetical protein